MPHSSAPTPERFFDAINAFQRSAAMKAALELDLFTAIGEDYDSAEALAAHCKISLRGARILADYLTVLGFLTKHNGLYSLAADAAVFLDRNSPAYVGDAVEFLQSPHILTQYAALTERVRHGGAPAGADNALAPNHEVWVRFARAMGGLMFMPAQNLAKFVLKDLSGPMKVLDIAAGHGMFGIAFAQQNPRAHVVALDWPVVLTVALENANRFGVADRFLTLPGSAFDVHLSGAEGGGYDIVLLPNFLHHFDTGANIGLLRKVHAALNPGGIAATLEFAPNDDQVNPPGAAAFALVMLASTPAGDAYTVTQLSSMYAAAGFGNIQVADLPGSMERVIMGTK